MPIQRKRFKSNSIKNLLSNSIFSAIIEVKNGQKKINRVISGNKFDFLYIESGVVTKPEKDRKFLLVFLSKNPIPDFEIFMIRNNSLRFGLGKDGTISLKELYLIY